MGNSVYPFWNFISRITRTIPIKFSVPSTRAHNMHSLAKVIQHHICPILLLHMHFLKTKRRPTISAAHTPQTTKKFKSYNFHFRPLSTTRCITICHIVQHCQDTVSTAHHDSTQGTGQVVPARAKQQHGSTHSYPPHQTGGDYWSTSTFRPLRFPLPIAQEARWAPKALWKFWEREKSLKPSGHQSSDIRGYNPVTINS